MPDAWESDHGLDPHEASDGNATGLSGTYFTNLEMYLNGLLEQQQDGMGTSDE